MDTLATVIGWYRRGQVREAEEACREALRRDADDAGFLGLLAEILLSTGRSDAALPALTRLARLQPGDAANHRRLGGALLAAGRLDEAVAALRRAADLEPDNARGHNNLGQALRRSGELAAAIVHLQRSVTLAPRYAVGHYNLGLALAEAGRDEEALGAFARAGDCDPAQADALTAGAALLLRLNRAAQALQWLEAALARRPGDAATTAQKGSALLLLERPGEALQCADEALGRGGDFVAGLHVRAAALCRLNRPQDAMGCFDAALGLEPANAVLWRDRGIACQQLGDAAAAAASFRQAIGQDPGLVSARTGLIAALIPPVPLSTRDARDARDVFERELETFQAWLAERSLREEDAWSVASQQFFYLSYDGLPDRQLLQRFRTAGTARLQHFMPAPAPPGGARPGSDRQRRTRLAVVSAHVCDHSVFHAITHGWLQCLDRGEFEITLFSLGARHDATTQAAMSRAEHVESGVRAPRAWAEAIRAAGPDAILFPEVGIDRTTIALASLRHAPRQFVCWGHPDTTGLATLDGFLSAQYFEPPGADDHYSERLLRLPRLGVHYEPAAEPAAPVDLASLGIHVRPVLVCPGTPFKYRPEHDAVLVEIARRVGPCTFVFFEHERAMLSHRLRERISAEFRRAGLEPERYLAWLPWLPRPAFLGLLAGADVYLDTIGFSGFNTMMQAIEARLPAVSHEGRFMRGRLGSGILRHLGLAGLVGASTSDYVDIAVRLATSAARRDELRAALGQVAPGAFADAGAIDALSELLREDRVRV